jgi:hypothetical protein
MSSSNQPLDVYSGLLSKSSLNTRHMLSSAPPLHHNIWYGGLLLQFCLCRIFNPPLLGQKLYVSALSFWQVTVWFCTELAESHCAPTVNTCSQPAMLSFREAVKWRCVRKAGFFTISAASRLGYSANNETVLTCVVHAHSVCRLILLLLIGDLKPEYSDGTVAGIPRILSAQVVTQQVDTGFSKGFRACALVCVCDKDFKTFEVSVLVVSKFLLLACSENLNIASSNLYTS